jgi:hypothetical protein
VTAIPAHVLTAEGERAQWWQQWCEINDFSPLDLLAEAVRRKLSARGWRDNTRGDVTLGEVDQRSMITSRVTLGDSTQG